MSVRVGVVSDDPAIRSALAALILQGDAFELAGDDDADVIVSDRLDDPLPAAPHVVVGGADRARELLVSGARAVLAPAATASELQAAVSSVAAGLFVLDSNAVAELLARRAAVEEPMDEPLTPRELQVLGLMAEGLSNKGIGARLGISENTVKFHVNALLSKLDAETRTEAVVRGARFGLVML